MKNKSYITRVPNDNIIKAIENYLFDTSITLKPLYDQLMAYEVSANESGDAKLKEKLMDGLKSLAIHKNNVSPLLKKCLAKNVRTLAMDLPIEIKSTKQSNSKNIVVIAMDPLSPLEQPEPEKDFIGYWIPFSLVDSETTGEKSYQANSTFFSTLVNEYNVYITDIYKLFYRIGDYPADERSNRDPEYLSLSDSIHIPLLNFELEIMQPDAIITLGNNARNALLQLNNISPESWDDIQVYSWENKATKKATPLICLPHISGTANGTSTKILAKYPEITGTKTERMAQLILKTIQNL